MEEHIKQIESLVEANNAIEARSPWLDISRGHLQSALEYARHHVAHLAKAQGTKETAASGSAKEE